MFKTSWIAFWNYFSWTITSCKFSTFMIYHCQWLLIITVTQIKSLVSQSDFERYDRLLLQNTLDVMPDVEYCPRIQCQKPVVVDKDDDMGYCQACDFPFCTKCKSTYHGTDLCKWEKDLLAVESKKKEADKKWNYKRMPVGLWDSSSFCPFPYFCAVFESALSSRACKCFHCISSSRF